jgi:hypothetical protein
MREDITVHNFSGEAAGLIVTLHVESDLADLYKVKIEHADVTRRLQAWRQDIPLVFTPHPGLARALERGRADLDSLRISIHVSGGEAKVHGWPDDIELIPEPRTR